LVMVAKIVCRGQVTCLAIAAGGLKAAAKSVECASERKVGASPRTSTDSQF
jgi:hypothetical protein